MVKVTRPPPDREAHFDTTVLAWTISPHPRRRDLDYFADVSLTRFRRVVAWYLEQIGENLRDRQEVNPVTITIKRRQLSLAEYRIHHK